MLRCADDSRSGALYRCRTPQARDPWRTAGAVLYFDHARSHIPTMKKKPAAVVDPVGRADERRSISDLRTEHGRLIEMLREERERNAFMRNVGGDQSTPTLLRTEKRGKREMCAVVLASDWHVEETVPAVKAGYRNEYNLEIADASIKRFFTGIIDLVTHHRSSGKVEINSVVLALMGDLMTGYIHEELMETNALSPVETALWLKPRLIDGMHTILENLGLRKLLIPCSYGNHGRTTHKSRISTGAENSYEWLLYKMIESDFSDDKRVSFDTSPTPHQYVEVFGQTLHFHHGDSLKYMGGVGGLGIPLLKAKPAWDDIRYSSISHIGHFHQQRDYGRAMVNGSLIGFGPYSGWIKAGFEPPQQTFYLFDSKRGKTMTSPIWVRGEETDAKALRRSA